MTTLKELLIHLERIKLLEEEKRRLEDATDKLRTRIAGDRDELRIRTADLFKRRGRYITLDGVVYDVTTSFPSPLTILEDLPCPPATDASKNTDGSSAAKTP